ncbi:MAG TPA: hypothetical protein VNL34_03275 [Candidatus Nitrosotenuis sp.]|nr:hypothetical protein [Candidatus Nitrosotenuis sp.]
MGYLQASGKQERTQSITFRLPKRILEQIELEAKQNNVSENVLVRQILTNYIDWFRLSKGIVMMPITKELLGQMNKHMDISSINNIVKNLVSMIRTFSIIRYGKYNLDTIFDALSMYIQMSNSHIVHLKEKNIHRFLISHNLGMTWSLILEELFRTALKEFVPVENIKFKTTDDSLIVSLLSNDD